MADTTHKSRKRSPNIRRKNLTIDQTKLDRVVQHLEVRSEMEAVDQALDLVLFRQELVEGVQRIAGSSGVESFLGDGHRHPERRERFRGLITSESQFRAWNRDSHEGEGSDRRVTPPPLPARLWSDRSSL